MALDIKVSSAEIKAYVDSLDLSALDAPVPRAEGQAGVQGGIENFCKLWPTAKSVLEVLAKVGGFPAATVVKIIIEIGDGIFNKKCNI